MSYYNSRPYALTKDGIGLIEGMYQVHNGTGERTQQGGEVRAVLRYLVTAIGRPTKLIMVYQVGKRLRRKSTITASASAGWL